MDEWEFIRISNHQGDDALTAELHERTAAGWEVVTVYDVPPQRIYHVHERQWVQVERYRFALLRRRKP